MSTRLAKVNALVATTLSMALPRLIDRPDALATVTRVETSPDLREARVWISTYTDEAWDAVVAAGPDLQASLAEHIQMKRTPRIQLRRDEGGAHAAHIDELLRGQQ